MDLLLTPSDFVAYFNQSIEMIYPAVTVEGEVANLRIARDRWLYFDIKDETASIKVFGAVYQLNHQIDDGMLVRLVASPRLHPLYNFSLNVISVTPSGEGSIKKASELLQSKLAAEGLFDSERKRPLPYPPERIGLITSSEAAAYSDFVKILEARWPLAAVRHREVMVQGERAAEQVVAAIHAFNQSTDVDVLVIVRGGGSADDLLAFSDERLVRAVAESRIPTLVAIGHERDISLAELAADLRASTPSNAAELLVPDKRDVMAELESCRSLADNSVSAMIEDGLLALQAARADIKLRLQQIISNQKLRLKGQRDLLLALDPVRVLKRGYALVRRDGAVISSSAAVRSGERLTIQFHDGQAAAVAE